MSACFFPPEQLRFSHASRDTDGPHTFNSYQALTQQKTNLTRVLHWRNIFLPRELRLNSHKPRPENGADFSFLGVCRGLAAGPFLDEQADVSYVGTPSGGVVPVDDTDDALAEFSQVCERTPGVRLENHASRKSGHLSPRLSKASVHAIKSQHDPEQ